MGWRRPLLILAAAATLVVPTAAQELERDRQAQLCAGLVQNRHLPSGTEVDCISDTHAIEVDFTSKWAEAIGQALQYASALERLPGIILVCRAGDDPSLCLKHRLLIEETVSYWRIGMTLWLCGADDVRLDQCARDDIFQPG